MPFQHTIFNFFAKLDLKHFSCLLLENKKLQMLSTEKRVFARI